MQLKTLLYNRGIFTQNVRSVGWIGIAYFLCLSFALPIQILMLTSKSEDFQRHYYFTGETLFRFFIEFQLILMFTVPVLLGIFLFRYMNVKLSADYIHSLPVKRETLYHQNVIFGIVLLIIPVVITGILLLALSGFVDAPNVLNFNTIVQWVATTILVNAFVFMATVFVAVFTGISVFQGVLTYVLLVFPAGVTLLFFMNVKYLLHGFAVDYYLSHQIERILPFVPVSDLRHSSFSLNDIAVFIGVSVAFYLIALFVYKKRDIEMAGKAVAFKLLQPVFLYGVTFCAMLLGGMYFGETQGTFGWRLFGYFALSIIGYTVAQMILEKTWRVLTKWKQYVLFAVAMGLVALLVHLDVTGYENRIPKVEEVERVYFADSVYWMDGQRNLFQDELGYVNHYYYQEEENIKKIAVIHEEIIENKNLYESSQFYRRNATIAYELTNGRKIVRTYQVPVPFYQQPNQSLANLMESEEYKNNHFPILKLDHTEDVNFIRISSYHQGQREIILTNPEDIKEFHQLLQTDIRSMSHEDFIDERRPWASIDYSFSRDDRSIRWLNTDWKKSFERIEAWLEERELANEVRLSAKDIDFAIVAKRDHNHLNDYYKFYHANEDFQTVEGSIRIDDAEQLEISLRTSTWRDDGEYVIAYFYKDQLRQPHFETIPLDRAPDFIKQPLGGQTP